MSEAEASGQISSGLVHLAHQVGSEKRNSGDSVRSLSLFPPVTQPERSWKWKSLRQEFQTRDSQKLFDKYQTRLQHSFFVVLLLMNILFNVTGIALFFFDDRRALFPGPAIMRATAILIYAAFFAMAWHEEDWLKPKLSRSIAAAMTLVTMMFAEYGTALYMSSSQHNQSFFLQKIRPAFYLIVANHVFLPFPNRCYVFAASLMITSIEIFLAFRTRIVSDCPHADAYRYAIADFVFYSTAAIIGYLLTHLLEIANRRGFLDHKKCVESKLKLDLEKEKEEQLLHSCIPKHLTERVHRDIKSAVTRIQTDIKIANPRPFNELYMEKYTNVSILYADIVNSMNLTSKLTPCDLIETLNDLYGRFDETAERNNCLRIKLLGDCYYLVSGVPTYDSNHAINCVLMGLEMIDIVKGIRDERFVDISMRIGVHTGMVLCGLIGLNKWQYDIWSKDSMRASQMEHEGVPGKVHVTQTSLDLIPKSALTNLLVIPRDKKMDGEQTYLIERRTAVNSMQGSCSPSTRRKSHLERLKKTMGNFRVSYRIVCDHP
jgi:class 3 adenylate cyclase